MSTLWDDVKNAIVDGYVYASDKAEELTQIGRARMDVVKANRKIAQAMTRIGDRVFQLFEDEQESSTAQDAKVVGAVEEIRSLRREISRLEEEIERVKAERDESKSVAPSE
jgi:ubiquinone biosynthesis protein UbiJ